MVTVAAIATPPSYIHLQTRVVNESLNASSKREDRILGGQIIVDKAPNYASSNMVLLERQQNPEEFAHVFDKRH